MSRLWGMTTWMLRWVLTPAEARKVVDWARKQAAVVAVEVAHAQGYREGYHAGVTDGYTSGQAAGEAKGFLDGQRAANQAYRDASKR